MTSCVLLIAPQAAASVPLSLLKRKSQFHVITATVHRSSLKIKTKPKPKGWNTFKDWMKSPLHSLLQYWLSETNLLMSYFEEKMMLIVRFQSRNQVFFFYVKQGKLKSCLWKWSRPCTAKIFATHRTMKDEWILRQFISENHTLVLQINRNSRAHCLTIQNHNLKGFMSLSNALHITILLMKPMHWRSQRRVARDQTITSQSKDSYPV